MGFERKQSMLKFMNFRRHQRHVKESESEPKQDKQKIYQSQQSNLWPLTSTPNNDILNIQNRIYGEIEHRQKNPRITINVPGRALAAITLFSFLCASPQRPSKNPTSQDNSTESSFACSFFLLSSEIQYVLCPLEKSSNLFPILQRLLLQCVLFSKRISSLNPKKEAFFFNLPIQRQSFPFQIPLQKPSNESPTFLKL